MCFQCDEVFEDGVQGLDELLRLVASSTPPGITPGQAITYTMTNLLGTIEESDCQASVIQKMCLQFAVAVHRLNGATQMGVTL